MRTAIDCSGRRGGRARSQSRIRMQGMVQCVACGGDRVRVIHAMGDLVVMFATLTPRMCEVILTSRWRMPSHAGLVALSAGIAQRPGCTPHGRDATRLGAQPDRREGEAAGRAVAAVNALPGGRFASPGNENRHSFRNHCQRAGRMRSLRYEQILRILRLKCVT